LFAQGAVSLALGVVLPAALYLVCARLGVNLAPAIYAVTLLSLLIVAVTTWVQALLSLRRLTPPATTGELPPATALIVAYLPNEAATIRATVEAFLRLAYPGPFQVLLAYDTPRDLPVEAELRALAERDARFLPLRVAHSTSKSACANAALAHITGAITGLFDADHHPRSGGFERAWRWLDAGVDAVQGCPVVRNGAASALAAYLAVEWEANGAVCHDGRARLHGFGFFGGSDGYWRTATLRRLRFDPAMLCEDTELSLRALEQGARIVVDPALVSSELAPVRAAGLWHQRLRWIQGNLDALLLHAGPMLHSRRVSIRQKLGFLQLLFVNTAYPWLVLQIAALALARLIGGSTLGVGWAALAGMCAVLLLGTGPAMTLGAWRFARPEVRGHARWFAAYLLLASVVDTPLKAFMTALAQVRGVLRAREWVPTVRST